MGQSSAGTRGDTTTRRQGETAIGTRRDAIQIEREYFPDQRAAPAEVRRLQAIWARRVQEEPLPRRAALIAGCDVHMRENRALAVVVVLRSSTLDVIETARGEARLDFPYVPGLLSWRELPALLDALGRLTVRPDLLFADGQGRAHPRRFGLACHLGLATGLPALGCAKSILRGEHAPLPLERGASAPLIDRGEMVGTALRTKDRVAPLYISVGHRVTLDEAVEYVLRCCTKYRLPEPSRLAHREAQSWARGA